MENTNSKVRQYLLVGVIALLLVYIHSTVVRAEETSHKHGISAEYSDAFERAVAENDVTSLINCAPECTYPNENSPLGTNLFPPVDYSPIFPFTDAFKTSREWIPQNSQYWNTKEYDKLDLDEHGWVKSLPASNAWNADYRWVATLMFNNIGEHYPAGYYTVLYEGEGTIEYGHDADVIEEWSTPGRDFLQVMPTENGLGILLKITETDPNNTGNYIRNIRVLMPGYNGADADASPFHPYFIQNIEQYKVLRFMDWMRTNYEFSGSARAAVTPDVFPVHPYELDVDPLARTADISAAQSWQDRPEVADARYSTEEGVPLEVMIDLANLTGADPWFNMPHQANDSYVWNFAQMVKANLNAEQRIYVEYSNEVWNTAFQQGDWVEQQGMAEWSGGTESDYTKRLNYFGMRSAEICNLWEYAFGDDSERVICVIGAHATNSSNGALSLDCPLWSQAPCYQHNVDAVAIAPYFGQHVGDAKVYSQVSTWANQGSYGLSQLFQEITYGNLLPSNIQYFYPRSLQHTYEAIEQYAELVDDRNIDMVAYEGGQHLAALGGSQNDNQIIEMFADANRDSRMAPLYTTYLNRWFAEDGKIFVHFTNVSPYNKHGYWGAQEYYDVPLPKQQALLSFINTNPCDWDECYPADQTVTEPATPTPTATPVPSPTPTPQPTATPSPAPTFVPAPTATATPSTSTNVTPAAIYLPEDRVRSSNGQELIPVYLSTEGHNISAMEFALEYDAAQILFKDTDIDNDGVPESILFNTPAGYTPSVHHSIVANKGRIEVRLAATSSRNAALTSAPIMYILLDVGEQGQGITFSQTAGDSKSQNSFGTANKCQDATSKAIPCETEGVMFRTAGGPTAISGLQGFITGQHAAQFIWLATLIALLLIATLHLVTYGNREDD